MEMIDVGAYTGRYNRLAGLLLRRSIEDWNENTVISPLSILLLLALVADSTTGNTKKEIVSFLGDREAPRLMKHLMKQLSADRSLSVANAVCVRKDLGSKMNAVYKEQVLPEYGAVLFSSNDVVRDVNRWVAWKTNGLIREVAPENIRDVLMALISAVTFDAKWNIPYTDESVLEREFTNLDGTKSRVMMLHGAEWTFLENDDFTGFEKDYEGSDLSFVALLPKKQGAAALAEAVERLDFSSLRRSQQLVYTRMPEFRVEFKKELAGLCQDLGIREVFTDAADFSPASEERLKLSSILHKAMIEVNQHGTQAAAVTVAYAVMGCLPPEKVMEVFLDRPFVFGLIDSKLGIPVFTGAVTHLDP